MPRLSPERWGHDKFSILEEEEMFEKEKAKMEQEQSQPQSSSNQEEENISMLEDKKQIDKEMEGIEQVMEEKMVERKQFVSGVSQDQEMVDMTDKVVHDNRVDNKTAC